MITLKVVNTKALNKWFKQQRHGEALNWSFSYFRKCYSGLFLGIYYEGTLVGMVVLAYVKNFKDLFNKDAVYPCMFMIGKDYVKQGYAKATIKYLQRMFNDKKIVLLCMEDKIEFYKKLGFINLGKEVYDVTYRMNWSSSIETN
jgi:GNAT superfamily N-acetyltransferase